MIGIIPMLYPSRIEIPTVMSNDPISHFICLPSCHQPKCHQTKPTSNTTWKPKEEQQLTTNPCNPLQQKCNISFPRPNPIQSSIKQQANNEAITAAEAAAAPKWYLPVFVSRRHVQEKEDPRYRCSCRCSCRCRCKCRTVMICQT